MSFGNFQKPQEKPGFNPRFMCVVCGEGLMSDEALQLHRIWHALTRANEATGRRLDEITKQLERNRAFGTSTK